VLPVGVGIESVDIWFQDETRVRQRGTTARTWARKEARPQLVHQQQFEYAYIFGAVCPIRDQAVDLVLPSADTEAMLVHLERISMKIRAGRQAVIVLDKAAWHTTKPLKRVSNISLPPLPPALPTLNPTEQVWQAVRGERLANQRSC